MTVGFRKPHTTPMSASLPLASNDDAALELARNVLQTEAEAVQALAKRLDAHFLHAVALILQCKGRVVVSGIGKSGHIARKMAATFASTGTPALFVHAAEAAHGDLGMITRQDVLIALSYSGEGDELLRMLPVAKREGTPLMIDGTLYVTTPYNSIAALDPETGTGSHAPGCNDRFEPLLAHDDDGTHLRHASVQTRGHAATANNTGSLLTV